MMNDEQKKSTIDWVPKSEALAVTAEQIQSVRDKARNLCVCCNAMRNPLEAHTYASAVQDTLDFLFAGSTGLEARLRELNAFKNPN